jgi:hypothetical protein
LENTGKKGTAVDSKLEVPAGVTGIAIVVVFSGVGYVAKGVGWLFGLLDPALLLISLFYSCLLIGGGIIMILFGRGLVHLKWWGLWGTIAMIAVTILVILISPSASFEIFDETFARISGAIAFFIIFCYLAMPAVRSRFERPDTLPV